MRCRRPGRDRARHPGAAHSGSAHGPNNSRLVQAQNPHRGLHDQTANSSITKSSKSPPTRACTPSSKKEGLEPNSKPTGISSSWSTRHRLRTRRLYRRRCLVEAGQRRPRAVSLPRANVPQFLRSGRALQQVQPVPGSRPAGLGHDFDWREWYVMLTHSARPNSSTPSTSLLPEPRSDRGRQSRRQEVCHENRPRTAQRQSHLSKSSSGQHEGGTRRAKASNDSPAASNPEHSTTKKSDVAIHQQECGSTTPSTIRSLASQQTPLLHNLEPQRGRITG